MNRKKSFTLIAASAAAILALSACSTPSTNGGDDKKLRVVATTTQLADWASVVGGDEIELTGLLTAGASAHHFDPTEADLIALSRADVLIMNGAGLEEFMDSAITASGFSGSIIDASEGVDLDLASEITLGTEEADHDHDHDDDGAHEHGDDHDHDHGDDDTDDHDHDHGDLNPHLWTSLAFAQGMVHEIGHGLADADSANGDLYEERAHAYMHVLEELDDWIKAGFNQVPVNERVIVTGHDSMTYFLHDYDITFVGALLPSFEDNAEPSAAEIDALIDAIGEHGVRAIFVESSLSPKLAEAVATQTNAVVVDDSPLYVDSLGAVDSGAETFIDATVHNTRVILEAWGITPGALPTH